MDFISKVQIQPLIWKRSNKKGDRSTLIIKQRGNCCHSHYLISHLAQYSHHFLLDYHQNILSCFLNHQNILTSLFYHQFFTTLIFFIIKFLFHFYITKIVLHFRQRCGQETTKSPTFYLFHQNCVDKDELLKCSEKNNEQTTTRRQKKEKHNNNNFLSIYWN